MNHEKLKDIIHHYSIGDITLFDVLEFLARQDYFPRIGVVKPLHTHGGVESNAGKVFVDDDNVYVVSFTIRMAILKYLERL